MPTQAWVAAVAASPAASGCDTFAPIGPWLVAKNERADTQNLGIWLAVGGERRQDGRPRRTIFGKRTLVSYLGNFLAWIRGAIISTGMPGSVALGMKPRRLLRAGQTVRLGADGSAKQTHNIIRDRHSPAAFDCERSTIAPDAQQNPGSLTRHERHQPISS